MYPEYIKDNSAHVLDFKYVSKILIYFKGKITGKLYKFQ